MRCPTAKWWLASSIAATFALSGLRLESGRSQETDLPESAPAAAETASADQNEPRPKIDPLSVNATCYVCHTVFVWEEISKQHLAEDVTCIECHGLSAGHANDENIGATKPDTVYERNQIDAMCQKCHAQHDVPPRDVITRFLERKLTVSPAVCTDCHGEHRIEAAELEEETEGEAEKEREKEGEERRSSTAESQRRRGCAGSNDRT
jgi:hypothetical protein